MNKLSIKIIWAQELPDEMKAQYDIEEDDYSNFMIVKHGDEIISIVNDCMEPEDAMFTRSLSWIAKLLIEVYELGKHDGCSRDGTDAMSGAD